jgi:hypothetical protein
MRPSRATIALIVVGLALVACGGAESSSPTLDLGEQRFDALDSPVLSAEETNGIVSGALPEPQFNSNPATSGPYAQTWARCGVYRQEIPDIYLVASMRRGAVVINYEPALEPADIAALGELATSLGEGVIVAPRPGLDVPIVLAAWTTLLELDELDVETIRAFVAQFGDRAPANATCPMEIDEAA